MAAHQIEENSNVQKASFAGQAFKIAAAYVAIGVVAGSWLGFSCKESVAQYGEFINGPKPYVPASIVVADHEFHGGILHDAAIGAAVGTLFAGASIAGEAKRRRQAGLNL